MREIELRLRTISDDLNHKERVRLKLLSLRTALMQDLLTGKVRVNPLLTEQRKVVTT